MIEDLDPEGLPSLLDAAAKLPRSVEPERDAWPAIRDRIEARRVQPIAPGMNAGRPVRGRWLAAAAVLLIALSSGLTAIVLDRRNAQRPAPAVAQTATEPTESVATAVARPVEPRAVAAAVSSADTVFARYELAASELTRGLREKRARMDPVMVAVIDSCLWKVDAAIAEARVALRAHPKSTVVAEMLAVTYRHKLDLLKRAADLPSTH